VTARTRAPAPASGRRIELGRRFDVPLRSGFDYITDPANWPEYWPGFVGLDAGSRWREPGDRARLVLRLLGRPVELDMTLTRLEPYRLVEYTSLQRGLPPARHERHFVADGDGFRYRLVVELAPRPGMRGVLDRILVARATARALRQTLDNLQRRLG
jgi:uncharacterized protein YndB with AHSA1/START domain